MSIVAWVFLGLVSGYIASKIVNHSGEGVLLDIALGVVGAVAGGFLFGLLGYGGVSGFNLWSIFVAVTGSVVVLAVHHAFTRRRLAR
jgi:uncharacterized membrane protein YeaQ/YmgE (transglycosylase-associated protein family)